MISCSCFHKGGSCCEASGGGMAIGDPVTDGTANHVLFVDAAGNLGQAGDFLFDSATGFLSGLARVSANRFFGSTDNAGAPDFTWTDDPNTGIFNAAADDLGIALGGVEAARFGGTGPDSDQTFAMGRCLIDSRVTDIAYFSHRDRSATTDYALRQQANGSTVLNCEGTQSVQITVGNATTRFNTNSTGIGFFGVTPVARPNITGSRGGNAALADLLTKGALLGLWTDGSS